MLRHQHGDSGETGHPRVPVGRNFQSTEFSGEGTAEKPFLLYNADDLLLLSKLVNEEEKEFRDQYFALANDIDMSGIEFTPIGKCGSGHYFWGCFDGNGYAIKNILIDIPDSNNGLFGELGGIAVNIIIDGGEIKRRLLWNN